MNEPVEHPVRAYDPSSYVLRREFDELKEEVDKQNEKIDGLRRWQSFVFGAAAATGALIGAAGTAMGLFFSK